MLFPLLRFRLTDWNIKFTFITTLHPQAGRLAQGDSNKCKKERGLSGGSGMCVRLPDLCGPAILPLSFFTFFSEKQGGKGNARFIALLKELDEPLAGFATGEGSPRAACRQRQCGEFLRGEQSQPLERTDTFRGPPRAHAKPQT